MNFQTTYLINLKILSLVLSSYDSILAFILAFILTFINPFLVSEQKVMKISRDLQMDIIDLKTNSTLKTKFDEFSSFPGASDVINPWRHVNISQN